MNRTIGMGNQSMGMGMGAPGAYGNNSMMMGGGGGGGGMNSSMQMPRPGTGMGGMPASGGMGMGGMGGMGMGMSPQQWASMPPQQQQLWQQQQAMMMQQQGLCGSCQTCCQPTQPGMPVDTFICGNEAAPTVNALNPLETTCDCATIATFFFALLSIVGFGVSVGLKDPDSIFSIYNETAPVNTAELQQRMINDIPYLLHLQNLSNERTNNLTRRIITIPITTTTRAPTTTSTTTRPPTSTSSASSTSSTTIPSAGALVEASSPATAQPPATISHGVDYTSRRRAHSGQSAPTRGPHDGDYFEGSSENDPSRIGGGGGGASQPQERRRAFGRLDSYNITIDESINYLNVPADPLWNQPCLTTRGLSGTFGKVCVEQALTASAFYFQLYNWTVFRDTLYFIAMCGSILTLILVYMIHRQKNPPFGSPQHQKMLMDQSHGGQGFMGGQGIQRPPMGMNASMQQFGNNNAGMMGGMPNGAMQGMGMITDVPIKFADTNFFLAFRFAWGCASVVIFLWVATQMYAFWTMINAYKEFTRNELHSFWVDYEKKFVGTVVCVTLYLCWPLAHLCLEIGLFVVFFIPWYGFRSMCKPGVENVRYPVETPLDVIPGWVRIDMFFTEFRQLQRLGFSVQMWHLLTGSYEPFFEGCETPNPNLQMMPNPLGDVADVEANKVGTPSLATSTIGNNINATNNAMFLGGGALGAREINNGLDQSGMFPTANNNGISPTKSSNRKDRSENKEGKTNKEHSEHKRDRSKSKDREGKSKGRSTGGVDTSAAFESSTMLNMTNGGNFSPSEREDNGSKRRDKSEKKEKKDKGERSSSKRDKGDKSESSKKEKSKSKRDKKDKSGDSGVYPLEE